MNRIIRIALAVVLLVAAVATLIGCESKPTAEERKQECLRYVQLIQTEMKLFKADSGLDAPIAEVVKQTHAICPSGGTYSYDPSTELASCSIHGHL